MRRRASPACRASPAHGGADSQGGNELCPNGDHADEQRKRGKRGGLFHDGPYHGILPRTENEHCSLFVPRVKRDSIPDGAARSAAQSGKAAPDFPPGLGSLARGPSGLRIVWLSTSSLAKLAPPEAEGPAGGLRDRAERLHFFV